MYARAAGRGARRLRMRSQSLKTPPMGAFSMFSAFAPPVGAGFHPRPDVGFQELAVLSCWTLRLCCRIHPISLVLPKETGWSPKEKRFWGGGAPVRFRDPPASPTRVGAATRPLRCPLRGRIVSLAPRARGLGWHEVWPIKSFLPRFFTKKRAGSRGGALAARRSARNAPCASQSAGGGQRGNPRRGFPLCGRPKPPAARAATGHPTPGGGGTPPLRGVGVTWWGRRWTKGRVVEDADPYGGWETGRASPDLLRYYPAPGRGLA